MLRLLNTSVLEVEQQIMIAFHGGGVETYSMGVAHNACLVPLLWHQSFPIKLMSEIFEKLHGAETV